MRPRCAYGLYHHLMRVNPSGEADYTHRRIDENAIFAELRMICSGKERHITALLHRTLLDRLPVRSAAINVQVERSTQPVAVVDKEVDQSVVSFRPKALSDEVRAASSRLHTTKGMGGRECSRFEERDRGFTLQARVRLKVSLCRDPTGQSLCWLYVCRP